ncbi:MAG: hypothetical protein WCA35_12395 [Kovacikia sp.]
MATATNTRKVFNDNRAIPLIDLNWVDIAIAIASRCGVIGERVITTVIYTRTSLDENSTSSTLPILVACSTRSRVVDKSTVPDTEPLCTESA